MQVIRRLYTEPEPRVMISRAGHETGSVANPGNQLAPRDLSSCMWSDWGLAILAGLALLLIWGVTRVELAPGWNLKIVSPSAVSGDEPHYLMVVNSILFDHDLELQDAYERVRHGGLDAGRRWRRRLPDHHTILVNRRTGHHTLWMHSTTEVVVDRPFGIRVPLPEFAPSPDVYEVPAHPVAFPALLALVLAPFHPSINNVEPDVGFVLVLIAWAGTLATYVMARRGGFSRGPAILAAAVLLLASPWLPYCRPYYPETTIGLTLTLAIWAWSDDRPGLASFFAASAAILKPSFAVVGAGFLIEALRERRLRDTIRMAVILSICAVALCAFNYWLAGTPLISGTLSWRPAADLQQLHDTLLDPSHGLFIFAPWTIFAVFAIAHAFDQYDADSAMLRRMAMPLVLYVILLAITGFGPGFCYGPRYWVAFLPWLAVATMQAMRTANRKGRIACALLIGLAMAIAIPAALRLPQLYSMPASAAWQGL